MDPISEKVKIFDEFEKYEGVSLHLYKSRFGNEIIMASDFEKSGVINYFKYSKLSDADALKLIRKTMVAAKGLDKEKLSDIFVKLCDREIRRLDNRSYYSRGLRRFFYRHFSGITSLRNQRDQIAANIQKTAQNVWSQISSRQTLQEPDQNQITMALQHHQTLGTLPEADDKVRSVVKKLIKSGAVGANVIQEFGSVLPKSKKEYAKECYAKAEKAHAKGNYKDAFIHYELAIKNGFEEANFGMGVLYHEGLGVHKDDDRAIKHFKNAIGTSKGAEAHYQLSLIMESRGDLQNARMYNDYAKGQDHPKSYLRSANFVCNDKYLTQNDKWVTIRDDITGACKHGFKQEAFDLIEKNKLWDQVAHQAKNDPQDETYLREASSQGLIEAQKAFVTFLYDRNNPADREECQKLMESMNAETLKSFVKTAKHLFQLDTHLKDKLPFADECYRLGEEHQKEKNYSEALEYYNLAAEHGNEKANYNIGQIYQNGLGVKKDLNLAADHFLKVKDKALLADANYQLSLIYEINNDLAKAKHFNELAIKANHPNAPTREIVTLLRELSFNNNVEIIKKADEKLAQELEKINIEANKINIEAWYLAGVYSTDFGKQSNALIAFELAAKLGHSGASFALGLKYLNGTGVEKDLPKAKTYLEAAANKGDINALIFLAKEYLSGKNFPKDEVTAEKYLELLKSNGSNYCLGNYFALKGDFVKSRQHFEKVEKSDGDVWYQAQLQLAKYYSEGLGVEKDLKRAAELLRSLPNTLSAFMFPDQGEAYLTRAKIRLATKEMGTSLWVHPALDDLTKATTLLGGKKEIFEIIHTNSLWFYFTLSERQNNPNYEACLREAEKQNWIWAMKARAIILYRGNKASDSAECRALLDRVHTTYVSVIHHSYEKGAEEGRTAIKNSGGDLLVEARNLPRPDILEPQGRKAYQEKTTKIHEELIPEKQSSITEKVDPHFILTDGVCKAICIDFGAKAHQVLQAGGDVRKGIIELAANYKTGANELIVAHQAAYSTISAQAIPSWYNVIESMRDNLTESQYWLLLHQLSHAFLNGNTNVTNWLRRHGEENNPHWQKLQNIFSGGIYHQKQKECIEELLKSDKVDSFYSSRWIDQMKGLFGLASRYLGLSPRYTDKDLEIVADLLQKVISTWKEISPNDLRSIEKGIKQEAPEESWKMNH